MRWLAVGLAAMLLMAPFALGKEGGDDRGRGRGGDDVEDRGGHFQRHEDKWILRNDEVSIWFHHGERAKPMLKVFRTDADGNTTGFKLVLDELFETTGPRNDSDDGNATEGDDGDGPEFDRVRGHRINLHPAREWWTSVTNNTTETTVTMSHLFNQGNVTLVFHIPNGTGPVKFDVQVQDWDWADPANMLALRLKVLERNAVQEGQNATFTGGYVSWASSANATYPNGTSAEIPVEGHVRTHEEGARILLLFNGTGGYSMLDYDPTIGVIAQSGASRNVPDVGLAASLGFLAMAALVLRPRRRS